jgi:hypothetical protein
LAAGRVSAISPTVAGEPPPADDAPTMPAGVVCAIAPKIKSVFEAIRKSAPAPTRDANRIFKGVPVQANGSSDFPRRL